MLCGQKVTYKELQLKAILFFVTSASHGKSNLLDSTSRGMFFSIPTSNILVHVWHTVPRLNGPPHFSVVAEVVEPYCRALYKFCYLQAL